MISRTFARTLALLALLALGLPPAGAEAQAVGRLTGEVVAASSMQPLDGAQVSIGETGLGGLTNAQGRFVIINIPAGTYTVRVTVLGYSPAQQEVTITADQTTTANFQLEQTAVALDEIVVTGTAAEVRAREVGNSLDAITSRELENIPVTTPQSVLQGRIPGVSVLGGSGQPGSGGQVRIRGQVTASQTTEPLIYVDGIRIYNEPVSGGDAARVAISPLQDIAADDIERIEVIKGASATTLYGTEAAGGVIQIFTKRGVSGDPIWTAEVTTGFNNQGALLRGDDPSELFTQCGDLDNLFTIDPSGSGIGERVRLFDPTCPSDGNWFENGLIQRYGLSVRGGIGDVTYYLSGNFNDTEGTAPTSFSQDGGFRGNFDFRPIDDLQVRLNTAYTRRKSRFVEDGNNADGMLLNIGRGANGNFKGGREDDCDALPSDRDLCISNGYIFEAENFSTSNRFTTGLTLEYDVFEGLSNRFSVGWDYTDIENAEFLPFGYLRNEDGFFGLGQTQHTKLSLDYAGSYQSMFGDDLSSTFSWGGQVFRDEHRYVFNSTEGFAAPGDPTLETGGAFDQPNDEPVDETNAGFFFQEVLGWQDRLFLTGGIRVDGNSAFGDDFGLQTYPKLSLSYILSDYDFWPTGLIDSFKLRGAVGESGKAPGAFDKLRTWVSVSADEGEAGFTPSDVGNPDLGPERTREYEVGFDASLFGGRTGIEVTYYNASTTDALVGVTLPPSQGFLASRTENVGELTSEGLELQLTGTLLQTDAVEWTARANLAWNSTEAVDTNGEEIFADNKAEIREGFDVATYFGDKVMNPNEFAEPIIESDQAYGPSNPTRIYGFSTDLRLWNRIIVNGLLEHQGGHFLPNYTGYQNARRGAWRACYDIYPKLLAAEAGDASAVSDVTALQRAQCRLNGMDASHNSDFWVEDASFWRLRNVSLTWDVPSRYIQSFANRATMTVSGTNLFMWTDYTGLDPEVEDFEDRAEGSGGGGVVFDGTADYGRREYYNLPIPRTFLVSFRVTF